ncbi:MAG: FapA family protein, partial [Oscillospiraceae bacterium]
FRDRRFNVQNVFEVKGDVDASMGNIDFAGDVIVRGNVREGYLIKSKGSIVVMGVVEGASLISDGGITIQKGMNGMNKGIIRTQKGLTSKYLENCTAHVKGDVISESIIYCNINCDGEVRAEGKHGAVIGGNIVVRKDLVAKVIGSENNSPTNIVLGVSPDVMNERGRLQKELSNLVEQRKAIEVDMQYLAKLIKKGVPLNESKVAQVRKLKIQDPMNKMRTDQVQRRLFEIEEAFGEADNSYLSCINIYPGVKITIGSRVLNITQPNVNCKYMIVDGDIGFLARSASQR